MLLTLISAQIKAGTEKPYGQGNFLKLNFKLLLYP